MVPEASKKGVFGDSDSIYNSFGGRSAYNFEGNGTVGSVKVGAIFVTVSFVAKGRGELGRTLVSIIAQLLLKQTLRYIQFSTSFSCTLML